jgi:hypothetical protein
MWKLAPKRLALTIEAANDERAQTVHRTEEIDQRPQPTVQSTQCRVTLPLSTSTVHVHSPQYSTHYTVHYTLHSTQCTVQSPKYTDKVHTAVITLPPSSTVTVARIFARRVMCSALAELPCTASSPQKVSFAQEKRRKTKRQKNETNELNK